MAKPNMTRDVSGTAVQALKPTGVTALVITSGVSSSQALPAGLDFGEIARIAVTHDVYFKFGTAGLSADSTDILIPAGVEYFVVPPGATHFAALQVAEAGRCQVMEVN